MHAWRKLWMGLSLRCPNCDQGRIADGWFQIRETCPHCHVRFERAQGESTGAMIIILSLSPIAALLVFFLLYALLDEASPILLTAVSFAFLIGFHLLAYRHMRGLWIAIVYLTSGLYADEDVPPPQSKSAS